MTNLVDIHCHILPYVDDGAMRVEESDRMLEMQFAQGVRTICLTPHMRKGFFETSDDVVIERFYQLNEHIKKLKIPIRVFLSREYFCDSLFAEKLMRGDVICLGEGKHLLMEFSQSSSEESIYSYVRLAMECGGIPLIAHVERYPVLWQSTELVSGLVEMGAKIQINAGSVLGREGFKEASYCKKLIKQGLVHVVASDAHDPEYRPPELSKCAKFIAKKYGNAYAKRLMCINPLAILTDTEGEIEYAGNRIGTAGSSL